MHVTLLISRTTQIIEKAFDRHVRDRVEAIENDAVANHQFALKVRLDCSLGRRQEPPDGIVDKIQDQAAFTDPVADLIQASQCFN